MDKAEVFSEVTRRNALRKASGLPSLNVHAEYAHEVRVTAQREFWAIFEQHAEEHASEREAIRKQVLAESQAKHGPEFGETMAGRWTINNLTQKRFQAHIAKTYALPAPDSVTSKHTITYGGACKDTV